MIKLSVVIITLNEERNILRCINSAKPIADEIVVVDSFSTDRTVEICRAAGAKIIQNVFVGHIEQKNFALGHTSFNHVLSLDADEALSDELLQSIRELKEKWEKDCYYINRLTNYCGKWIRHGGWYPDRKLRLFTKEKAKWGGENPHDILLPLNNASAGKLKGDLLHYSFYSISEHVTQINKFTDIAAKGAFNSGKKVSVLQIILRSCFKFIRDYILLLGFLDGYYGYVICRLSASATFLKYIKLRQLHKPN